MPGTGTTDDVCKNAKYPSTTSGSTTAGIRTTHTLLDVVVVEVMVVVVVEVHHRPFHSNLPN